MTWLQKFKNWLIRKLGGQVVEKEGVIIETFNGYCPRCNEHIGAYIREKRGRRWVTCGVCNWTFEQPKEKPMSETEWLEQMDQARS